MKKSKARSTKAKISASAAQRKSEEMAGILLVIFGILVLISLVSFNPDEVPGRDLDPGAVKNQLGVAGVYISHYLIHLTIGYPVIIFPFIIMAWGAFKVLGREIYPLRRWAIFVTLTAYFISLSGAIYYKVYAEGFPPPYQFSGFLGVLGAGLLSKFLGTFGAIVVLIGMILITVVIFTSITFSDIFQILSVVFSRVWLQLQKSFHNLRSRRVKRVDFTIRRPQPIEQGEPVVTRVQHPQTDDFPPVQEQPRLRPQPRLKPRPVQEEDFDADFELEEPEMDVGQAQAAVEEYQYPPLELLQAAQKVQEVESEEILRANAQLLEEKLADFDIKARIIEIHPGPVITRYELQLAPGIKVSRITSLADDLAMAMRAKRLRIVAPIPGKAAVGIEIPNSRPSIVYLREILSSSQFSNAQSSLTIGLGKTISGVPFVTDLATMPHLLVAGSTGSGKSVCLNTIIASFLYKSHPSEVQLILIDPKRLELSTYARLYHHHLAYVDGVKEKVATTAKAAIAVLKSVELEMERRYELLAGAGVRNIEEYNQRIIDGRIASEDETPIPKLCYLIVIVDELADLMLTSSATRDVEEPIARLTQMSRAVGIHLILATQRPSVDVITGVIKANFPARIAFQVATKIDSRTILDMNGAEKLLGKGDMLFLPPASPEPIRIHNAFIGLGETEKIIEHICRQPIYPRAPLKPFVEEETAGREAPGGGKRDSLFNDAFKIVVLTQQGSVSILQRRLKVGYSRAARLIDELEAAGIVGPFEGSKARDVLMTPEELEAIDLDNEDFDGL